MRIPAKLTVMMIAAGSLLLFADVSAREFARIDLPAPDIEGGVPLMRALALRHTSRSFDTRELPPQALSNLLWAAAGINRPESGKRTAPTARNWQEIDIYVAMEEGLYLYDPDQHALIPVLAGDLRALTGTQDFAAWAPVNLVYVADYNRMGKAPEDVKKAYSWADTGFIAQNVYLYCASAGLASVVRGLVDREELEKAMELPGHKHVVFGHTVGYPASE
jgi:SagB-type dehydrogenase family enzyme